MKLRIGNKVYLQKYDVVFITRELSSFPMSLFDEVFRDEAPFIMMNFEDGLRFACVFEDSKNVEWLMAQDYFVDFEQYKEMPASELKALRTRLEERRSIASTSLMPVA